MKNVLVTGALGQLGFCLQHLSKKHPSINFKFFSSSDLDITKESSIKKAFGIQGSFDYCINCAAYTKVDLAEEHEAEAFRINHWGPELLAHACKKHNTKLIHVSTDFVFDGNSDYPYKENDKPNPIGIYGLSKLKGETSIREIFDKHFIIRTSWLYSEFGNNFVKTIIKLSKVKGSLRVVDDQIGSPTYAYDLAYLIIQIIQSKSENYGLYHFSNKGGISWFEFASKVFELKGISIDLTPVKSGEFKTLAKRPKFSVLDTKKVEQNLNIEILDWEERLQVALKNI